MGLPGSGKTTLAEKISKKLKADWLNADNIRSKFNDYDFTYTGIIRQVRRMKKLSTKSKKYSYPEHPAFFTPIFTPTPFPRELIISLK